MSQFGLRRAAFSGFLFCAIAVHPAAEAQKAVGNPPPADREHDLAQMFDEMWQNQLRDDPVYASSLGDRRYNALLTDVSPDAINQRLARDQNLLLRLSQIDPAGLTAQTKLSLDLAERDLLLEEEGARFDEWQMPVTQVYGFHLELPQLAQNVPLETAQDFDDYIARLRRIPAYVQAQTDNMQRGVDSGRVLPKFVAEEVLAEVNNIANKKGETSPFAAPMNKFPSSFSEKTKAQIRQNILEAISNDVLPSYARFARFLEAGYVPHGRAEPGAWALPDGDAYYAYCVRRSTTTDKTPAEIHATGLKEIDRDAAEERAIFAKLGVADVHALAVKIAADPKLHAASADALVASYRGYIAAMEPKLPSLFGNLPKSPLEVEAMPDFVARNSYAAYYEEGSLTSKRPGKVRVNTYDYSHRSLAPVEATAYHEGVPGHHLQISLAQEQTGLPEFRRHAGYTAFVEGWALYSEQLGKEIGFYKDPYSDFGRLDNDMWRAIRLVVDTGVHNQHWTRQQMVDVFHKYTAMDDTNINSEVDRYIAWPGQALAYKTGQMQILALRDYARQQLGAAFSLSAFHDEVLGAGAMPLDALHDRVYDWVAQQKKAHGKGGR